MTVVCLLAGCDAVWRLDDLEPGPEPVCFMPRAVLLDEIGNGDPTLRDDGLELFYARGGNGAWRILHATRTETNTPFAAGVGVTELASSGEDSDPAITADGLMIVFKSNRGGAGQELYQATRSTVSDPFTPPELVPGITGSVGGVDLSPDGLTIYIYDLAKLKMQTRTTRGKSFGLETQLTIDNAGFPSLSADGLELYYSAGGVVRRTRPDLDSMFPGATAMVVDDGANDGDLTPDGTRLVLIGDKKIQVRERCP